MLAGGYAVVDVETTGLSPGKHDRIEGIEQAKKAFGTSILLICCIDRSTNTPAQALAMLNDPFVHGQADVWAKRLLERKGDTVEARIDARDLIGRPSSELREAVADFVGGVEHRRSHADGRA